MTLYMYVRRVDDGTLSCKLTSLYRSVQPQVAGLRLAVHMRLDTGRRSVACVVIPIMVIGIYFAPGYPGPSASCPTRVSACSSRCAETRGLAWARVSTAWS